LLNIACQKPIPHLGSFDEIATRRLENTFHGIKTFFLMCRFPSLLALKLIPHMTANQPEEMVRWLL
jgi:hypothetical protein